MNQTLSITQDQVIAAEDKLLAAMKISDVATLQDLLHDDLLFIIPNGTPITKALDLEAHRSGTMVIDEIVRHIETVHIIHDNAVVVLTLNTKGSMLGQPIEGTFRYSRVWKLFGNRLKVISGSCTLVS